MGGDKKDKPVRLTKKTAEDMHQQMQAEREKEAAAKKAQTFTNAKAMRGNPHDRKQKTRPGLHEDTFVDPEHVEAQKGRESAVKGGVTRKQLERLEQGKGVRLRGNKRRTR